MQLLPWFFLVPTVGNFTPKRNLLSHHLQMKPSQLIVEEKKKWQEIMSSDQVELLKI